VRAYTILQSAVWTDHLAREGSGTANEARARRRITRTRSSGEYSWHASFHGQMQGTRHFRADAGENVGAEWMQWILVCEEIAEKL
jgi:hypothetical protein